MRNKRPQPSVDELLETADAAALIDKPRRRGSSKTHVSTAYVRRLAALGKLKAIAITPRGARLFRRGDVLAFAAARRSSRSTAA